MISASTITRLCLAALCAAWLFAGVTARAAEARKDSQSILNELRLKKWTKDLTLSTDQQKKVQGIFEEEQKEVAKVDSDTSLDINARRTKVDELRAVTYTKMKPLLDPGQLETFEKLLAKSAKPKRK